MNSTVLRNSLSWSAYPVVMTFCIALFLVLKNTGISVFIYTYIPVLIGAGFVTFLELFHPHEEKWTANKNDVKNDLLFMLFVQMVIPRVLTFFFSILLINITAGSGLKFQNYWPHDINIGFQAILMILIADFFRYWLHRVSHETKALWKLHAVHHSPKKLYWLNVGRFHPFDKGLQFLFDALPFIIIGIKPEVLALYFVFYAVNGFFQHCNIELKFGFLNYIISSAEVHRWHHSRASSESNSNYGNNIIIWDILFGTFFFPNNRLVEQLGLVNKDYPLDFNSQMKTPFIGAIDKKSLPNLNLSDILRNLFISLRMKYIKNTSYKSFLNKTKDPKTIQDEVLRKIIAKNKNTEFGKEHSFEKIKTYDDFKELVPVHDFEDLRPYFEKQMKTGDLVINYEKPVIYNLTSGTTGNPKFIPYLRETINGLRKSQRIFSYVQFNTRSDGFKGKLVGIVSPAIEGKLENDIPFGSASGWIYKTMPRQIRKKYLLPPEVFEIKDHEIKYYVLLRLTIEDKNVTYLGSANPTTFLKLHRMLLSEKEHLINDIENGTIYCSEKIDPEIYDSLKTQLKKNPKRAKELRKLFSQKTEIKFTDIWPYIKILTTWTGGSCGIALSGVLKYFPKDVSVIELGYLSSEFRGTITIDGNSSEGLPTIDQNFFEFVEKNDWENKEYNYKIIDELEIGKEYYVLVTNNSGLYRYNMNDILKVSGKINKTPTLVFVQKGKGVTNITGEKLYEGQIISVMKNVESEFNCNFNFYLMCADEINYKYKLYLELSEYIKIDRDVLSNFIDRELSIINLEYSAKRESQRLDQLVVLILKPGTYEKFKDHYVNKGQREGQFKVMVLQYTKDIDFPLEKYIDN